MEGLYTSLFADDIMLYRPVCNATDYPILQSDNLSVNTVADLGGVRGVQMHPPLAAGNVLCVHNCTSSSNDYAAVACISNNQAQLHTHVSVPY